MIKNIPLLDLPLIPRPEYENFFEPQKLDFNFVWELLRYRHERDFIFLRKLGIRTE